jgi:hypothetical protein
MSTSFVRARIEAGDLPAHPARARIFGRRVVYRIWADVLDVFIATLIRRAPRPPVGPPQTERGQRLGAVQAREDETTFGPLAAVEAGGTRADFTGFDHPVSRRGATTTTRSDHIGD